MARKTIDRMTNVEFLKYMMEYSKHGALMQAFIMEGARKYAEACAKADPAVFESPLLSGKAWHGCAVELAEAFNARR